MARRKHNEVKAGLFTIAAIVLLLAVILWLGAIDIFRPKAGEIFFFAPISTGKLGLTEGASVKINDVEIAKISRIIYLPKRGGTLYVADLVDSDYQIPIDTTAEVIEPFIGLPEVVISSLGKESEVSSEDQPITISQGGLIGAITKLSGDHPGSLTDQINTIAIKLIDTAGTFEEISRTVLVHIKTDEPNSIMNKIQKSLNDINNLTSRFITQTDPLEPSSLLGKVHIALDKLDVTITRIRDETDPEAKAALLAKVHASIDDINAMTKAAKPAVIKIASSATATAELIEGYIKNDVGMVLQNARKITDQALEIVVNFNKVSQHVKDIVALNHDNIDELLDNMKLVSDNLKATSTEIRRHPWKLLHRPSDSESRSQNIYDAARAFSEGAQQLDQATTKLKKLAEANPDGVPADDKNLKRIREHLIKVFDKFHKAEQSLWDELSK